MRDSDLGDASPLRGRGGDYSLNLCAHLWRQLRTMQNALLYLVRRSQRWQPQHLRTEYGCDAYLLTVAGKSPHTSFVSVTLESGVLRCVVGYSAAENITLAPNVSLFWPPLEPNGYALIVNGSADGQCDSRGVTTATIMPSKCVLHRKGPKPLDSDGPCASDCRRVRLAAGPQIAHAVQRPD